MEKDTRAEEVNDDGGEIPAQSFDLISLPDLEASKQEGQLKKSVDFLGIVLE
jgi:hypothetical protein